jgi:hypothetical protein
MTIVKHNSLIHYIKVCESTLTVIFSHQREDLEEESRTRRTSRTRYSFNMQGATQPNSNIPKCLREDKFDYEYPKLVYLIYLALTALFILKQKISWDQ